MLYLVSLRIAVFGERETFAFLFYPSENLYIERVLKPPEKKFILNQEITAQNLIDEAKNSIIPAGFSDTLMAKIDIIQQLTWKSNPEDYEQDIKAFYTSDPQFGNLPILVIDYDLYSPYPAFNGFSIKINPQNFSQREFKKISFYIKGDTERLKIEFKNKDGKRLFQEITGITQQWKKIELDRDGFSFGPLGVKPLTSDWEEITEIVLVFEDHRVTDKEGKIYLAGFNYPESWQVARTIENFYSRIGSLEPAKRETVLREIVGEGINYNFNPGEIEEIKSWIHSSQVSISEDSGIYALYALLNSLGKKFSFSSLRISAILSSLLSNKSNLRYDYTSSLYSLFRSAQINKGSLFALKLDNLRELEELFNQNQKKPLLIEFKTQEYFQVLGFERGGFLWLQKFINLDKTGIPLQLDEKEFLKFWSGYVLSPVYPSGYSPLNNQDLYRWENPFFRREELIEKAKKMAQERYSPVRIVPIPELDPPVDGKPESVGLVYEEYLKIGGDKFYDDLNWWAMARPRGSQNKYPLNIFAYEPDKRAYKEIKYDITKYNYSSATPPITRVPPEGQYITTLDLGRILVAGKFPQFFTLGGDGYLRFIPLAESRQMGASFRVAGHNVTWSRTNGDPFDEDFPLVREVYLRRLGNNWINLLALIDCEGFSGVMDIKLKPHDITLMEVEANFFPRRDILIKNEPHTGFAAFSSMFFLGEEDTPERNDDEAHDSDYLVVNFKDGTAKEIKLKNPEDKKIEQPFIPDKEVVSFSLQQRDRDPLHYSAFSVSQYATRPSFDLRIIRTNLPLKVKLFEISTTSEYMDNIVVLLAIKRDLHKGEEINLKYEVIAYDYQERG
ncbi:MAG: glucan biosynthesis protein [Candidatus Omnitrophica bacterium]|nr:glucan biosynthesis protein [Candidatus Omnitrophota bacterium]